jgi:NAD(P)-dependent dehydrogenase (short-subunit alcohol dehydrogenase family)
MRSLAGRKCLITGAASGIGRATALAAARAGARLFLTDIQAPGLGDVVDQVRREGGQVAAHRALDIADHAAVSQWAATLQAQWGSMDVLMNVAGISIWGAIEHLEHQHWRRTIEVNLMGPIHVLEVFVPPMIAAGHGGHVVNVSSAAGLFGLPWHAAYSASKYGLRGISDVLRLDLRRHGIGVSLVCPGAVNTGLVDTVQIIGVDMARPSVKALQARFQRHAVTPEKAAEAILAGVRDNRALVFTSRDIQLGYWLQRKCAWPFEWFMRRLDDRLYQATRG